MSAQVESRSASPSEIPIGNLWLLLLYASDLYRKFNASERRTHEQNPEDIANLVAEVLCHQVEVRLKRNLSYSYQSRQAILGRVRGRIDTLTTYSHRLLDKGKVSCRFDELTIDSKRNRYVRAALEKLATLLSIGMSREPVSQSSERQRSSVPGKKRLLLPHRCRSLAASLEKLGVSKGKPVGYTSRSERFGRHDSDDLKMLVAADFAFSLVLLNEQVGSSHLPVLERGDWLRKLFEKAIGGMYSAALDSYQWSVTTGQQIDWQRSAQSDAIARILPGMITDIVIEQETEPRQRLVIDTKFNSITKTDRRYGEKETIRSGYIYQMYAYLRSQEKDDDEASKTSRGMLLHPSVGEEVTEHVVIQGHPIHFCTVDLRVEPAAIRRRLLDLIEKCFGEGSTAR